MGIVVEVQRDEKERKRFTWPESLKAEGEARGEAKMLLRVLGHKRIEVTEEARERILSCEDPEQLEAWADKALGTAVTHIDELFGD